MDIRDLRCYCMVAEMEHVSKAADKLGVAQPYLTKMIGQIESEFGAELFDKVGRRIQLNQYGELFYFRAKKVLAEMENLYTEMDYALESGTRTITILCNTETYTPGLIIEFQKKNSNYGLKVLNATRKEMIEAISTGEADFALCDPPIDEADAKNIKTDIVCRDIACILLPPGHRLLQKKSVKLEELQGEKLITAAKGGAIRNHVDTVYEKLGIRTNIVCETSNLNLIIQAVGSGLGYAFVSRISLDRHPELKPYCVEFDFAERVGVFGLSYSRLSVDNRNIQDFLNFSIEYFQSLQRHIDECNL